MSLSGVYSCPVGMSESSKHRTLPPDYEWTKQYIKRLNESSDARWGRFDPSYLFDKEPDEVRTRNVAAIVSKAWDVWLGWIRLFFRI